MDQLRTALDVILKYHFWILLVLVVGLSTFAWFSGSSSLASQYKANKSKIDKEFKAQQSLRSKPFKPNEQINDKQKEEKNKQAAETLAIWEKLYDRQTASALKWPAELGEPFNRYIVSREFGDNIRTDMRDVYLNYIRQTFPNLVKIIDAEMFEEDGHGRSGGMRRAPRMEMGGSEGSSEPVEPTHMVDWLDQSTVREKLSFSGRPSSWQIWITQEDLWVYETLLRAIARTNEATGARRRNRMAIRTIFELQVGQEAASGSSSSGRIYVPEIAEGGTGFSGGRFGGGEYGGGAGFGGDFSGGEFRGGEFGVMGGETLSGAGLLNGRYLDMEGMPIVDVSEDRLDFGVEYKRLPIHMQLEIDERWLPRLITELANAPLQVEIEQVRINPDGVEGVRSKPRSMGGARGEDVEAFDSAPNVGVVVLQGNIYVFNKPNREMLIEETEEASI